MAKRFSQGAGFYWSGVDEALEQVTALWSERAITVCMFQMALECKPVEIAESASHCTYDSAVIRCCEQYTH